MSRDRLGNGELVPFIIDFTQTCFLTNAATKGSGSHVVHPPNERTPMPTHPGKEMRTSER